jgi:hypothetical protein
LRTRGLSLSVSSGGGAGRGLSASATSTARGIVRRPSGEKLEGDEPKRELVRGGVERPAPSRGLGVTTRDDYNGATPSGWRATHRTAL